MKILITIIFLLNYLNKTVMFTINLFIFFSIFYVLITFYLTYLILSIANKKNKINYIKYININQDWEFIQFKNNLFNLYYSSVIILFIYLFKSNGFTYLLEGLSTNPNFYFLLTIILFIYSILLSKTFILFLFNFNCYSI